MLFSPDANKEKVIKIKRILHKLMRLPELLIQNKFRKPKIAKVEEYIEKLAIGEILEERPRNLKRVAKIQFNSTHQILIKLIVLVVGSVVYSNTFRIYTASLGSFTWLAAIVGGFVASVGVDYLATQACYQYLCRQITRRALNQLERQKKQQLKEGENQFSRCFWDGKINFILDIEGDILAQSHEINLLGQKISIYVVAAVVLNLIEFTGAFYLVSKLGLFEDLPTFIQLVISSLPVVLTWMLAFVQADWFYRPSYAREILNKYGEKMMGMITEPIDKIYKALVRLDAGIEALLNRQSEYPTVELAELMEQPHKILENLVLEAQRYPVGSKERQICLTKLTKGIMQKSKQLRCRNVYNFPPNVYQEVFNEVLQQTFLEIFEKIDDYDQNKALVMTWFQFLLDKRFNDACDQLLKRRRVTQEGTKVYDDWEKLCNLIKQDPTGSFASTHIKNHPEASFQAICLQKFDQKSWKDISAEWGIPVLTLSRFYQRQIQKFTPIFKEHL